MKLDLLKHPVPMRSNCESGSKTTSRSCLQLMNAYDSSFLRLAGIASSLKPQPKKAIDPISSRPDPKETEHKFVQFLKAHAPILLSVGGRITSSKPLSAKASFARNSRPWTRRHAPRSRCFSYVQLKKTYYLISQSEDGAVKERSPDLMKAYSPMLFSALLVKLIYVRYMQ